MRKFGLISNNLFVLLFVVLVPFSALSQTWTAKSNMAISGGSNGFYEYLPAGYFDPANANKKYPVILFIHGIGETGNGSWDLSKVLWTGLPAYINQGRFPASFSVNGSQYSFIVICPQFTGWPGGADVDAYYDYIYRTYRADASRFYITGLSMGGGVTWDYVSGSSTSAMKVAAIVPICGASWPNNDKCKVMADAKLPVWATHNADDPTVGVGSTIGFVDGINAFNPTPAAQKTIWPSGGHDAWGRTYDPNTKLDGVRNCYEWMLQYSRGGSAPPPPPPPTSMLAWIDIKSDVTCFGAANGSATVSFNGGTAPFTYSWNTNPVQNAKTASNLGPGTYTVTIRDANNATATATTTINEPSKLQLTVTPGTITTAGGTTNVQLSATGGTAPYSYSGPTTNVGAGTYTYVVTDAKGCTDTKVITISGSTTTSSPIVAWIDIKTDVSCFNGSNGSATVSFNGGVAPFTYSWNSNPVQTSKTANNLKAGTYTVSIKDANNATATASVVINQPPALQLNVWAGTISAPGGTTSVSISASGGTPPYTYTGPTANVGAGTYTYTVTDAKGCVDSKTITISAPGTTTSPTIIAWIDIKTDVTCFGAANGNATVSFNGGVAPFTYSWSTNPVQTTKTAYNLTPGTYTVTVKDANNATAVATTTINEPSKLQLTVSPGTISVYGGTTNVNLSAAGGIPGYTFTGPTSGVKAGTYTYSVKDAGGCTDTKTITISEPAPPSLTVSVGNVVNVSCNGGNNGSATVSAGGGVPPYTYTWNTTPAQSGATATGLKAGTYEVTVTDALNASTKLSVSISEPAKLSLTATPGTITSYGGTTSVSLSASGGVAPYIYTGATTDLKAGTYNYEVRDANGCTDTKSITISEGTPPELKLNGSSKDVSCNGGNNGSATVSVSGGVGPYQYSWNTTPVQSGATATGLKAGTYEVTVTDALNASAKLNVSISEPAKLSLTATPGTITSYGGTTSVSLSASGGVAPYIYTGATTDLKAGTYNYEVRDANGCSDTKSITISEGTPPELKLNGSSKDVSCNGGNDGSATVSVSGGVGPYQYSWNTTPAQSGATATGLKAGTYEVTVTDALNATAKINVNISEPAKLSLSVVAGTIAFYGGTTNVTLTATGGSVPYEFFGTTANLKAGTHNFEVKDAKGCRDARSITITEPTPQELKASISDFRHATCKGAGNGSATVAASGGVEPYKYNWNTTPAQTTATANGLKAGMYTVTVTDALNVVSTATVTINEPSALTLIATTPGLSVNGGTADVELTAVGGTAPYRFVGQTTGLSIGTYSFSVIDAAGCSAETAITITEPAKLSLTGAAGTIKCSGGTTDVTLTATGGKPPYIYEGNTKELTAGTYHFSVTDAAGAKATVMILIKDPAPLELLVNPGLIKRVGGTTYVDINARGGTMPYTFTGEVSNLKAGTYTYVVTDANACTASKVVEIKEPKVNLAAFDVGTVDTAVRINWKTSYEYAIDHFSVEKSTDGSSFNPLGAVNSRWSAAALLDYIMNDVKPSPSKNVYRISAITIYGEKLNLQEKSITFVEKSKISVKNLSQRLEISISSSLEENITFMLIDMSGKMLKSVNAKKDVYTLRSTIDMQALPRGTYVLQILSPTIKSSKQVIRL